MRTRAGSGVRTWPIAATSPPGLRTILQARAPTTGMLMRGGVHQLTPRIVAATVDTTPPVAAYVSQTVVKVSRQATWDTTTVTWNVDEACQAWQIREVATAADPVSAGTLLASGGAVPAGVDQQTAVSSASLSAGDTAKLLKLFTQDLAGNWSV